MKNKFCYISVFGVFLGMFLSKIIASRYGHSGRILIAVFALCISLLATAFVVYNKRYVEALALVFIISPGFVIIMGMYLDNLYLAGLGLVLLFIIVPIIIKVAPKFIKK